MTRTTSIEATIARPPGSGERPKFTPSQTLDNEGLTAALDRVNRERARLEVQSPCEKDPRGWDGLADDGTRSAHDEAVRVMAARIMCNSYCPVLEQCRSVLRAVQDDKEVIGVIAGEWLDDTTTGGHIGVFMNTGSWPEGVNPHAVGTRFAG